MQGRRILILSLAAISLTISAAPADAWVAWQTIEPDVVEDADQGFMWPDAPGDVNNRIYFAVVTYAMEGAATGATVNPNVAAAGTNNEAPYGEYHEALFGVWTDCNGDGYIGMAEGAVREYPAQLLLDDTTCPPVGGAGTSGNRWIAGAHNYRGLVTEFVPISRADPTTADGNRDQRVYYDKTARVWGDFGVWDEKPTHRSCALRPLPRGTTSSTGGALNYVDCRVDVLGTWNIAMQNAGDPLGLTFANPDDAENSFADVDTAGTEDSEQSPATVWDCRNPPLVRLGDSLNMTPAGALTEESGVHNIAIYNVAPAVRETQDPTVPALYNETSEGLEGVDADPEGNDACDTSDDRGADFYGTFETDFNGVDPNNKREADWNFNYGVSNRGGAPVSLLGAIGGSGNAGMNENDAGVGEGGSRWTSDSVWLSKPGPSLVKTDIDAQSVGIADAYYLTFYAYTALKDAAVGSVTLRTPGSTGTYGSWHCEGEVFGIRNGWNCDPEAWYVNPDGTLIDDDDGLLARPGAVYYLRDTDCYDGETSGGVPLGAPALGDNPCA